MSEAAVSGRFYEVFDVFADKALAGNPLAVVHDSEGLNDTRMQAIAREFNLSETVFIFRPSNPAHALCRPPYSGCGGFARPTPQDGR